MSAKVEEFRKAIKEWVEYRHKPFVAEEPVLYACAVCRMEDGGRMAWASASGEDRCPKCKSRDTVMRLVVVHFAVKCEWGPIWGYRGRYALACNPDRPLAFRPGSRESYTINLGSVTCLKCLEAVRDSISVVPYQIEEHFRRLSRRFGVYYRKAGRRKRTTKQVDRNVK